MTLDVLTVVGGSIVGAGLVAVLALQWPGRGRPAALGLEERHGGSCAAPRRWRRPPAPPAAAARPDRRLTA